MAGVIQVFLIVNKPLKKTRTDNVYSSIFSESLTLSVALHYPSPFILIEIVNLLKQKITT